MKEIENQCKEWSAIVNIKLYMVKIQYFNFFEIFNWL